MVFEISKVLFEKNEKLSYTDFSPYSKHVISVDVIDRYVNDHGCLRTTRLILKRGKLPKWGAKLFKISETYILEDSIVDLQTNQMHTFIRNLDHTKVMKVIENQIYGISSKNSNQTFVNITARIKSSFGWGITNKIEKFGIVKFSKNVINVFQRIYFSMLISLESS
ncbi:unnamed protein product, partial [Pneumocystis jirovecii]